MEIRARPRRSYFCWQKIGKESEDMKEMEKLFNWIGVIFGIFGGWLSYLLGGWDVLLKTIVFLAVVDYFTGLIKAIYLKKLSSQIGFKGLLKKIVMFIIIATSYVLQKLLGGSLPLREIVIMFYICNEGISFLENAAVFVKVPDKLRDVLLQLRDKNSEGE